MSIENHVHDLLPGYAVGALEPDEANRVDEHVLSCWLCRTELAAYQDVAGQVGLSAYAEVEPSPQLKERLMQRVQAAQRLKQAAAPAAPARRAPAARLLPAWGLFGLLLIVALAVANGALWHRLNRLETITSAGGMRAVALRPSEAVPQATGFVIIGADGRNGALVVDRLPPLDEARQYQLWLIRDGQRVNGAVFSTDESGYRGVRIEATDSLLEYSAIDITIEPAGGSPQPTGDSMLSGPL